MLWFLPESWGSLDEDGDFESAREGIGRTIAIVVSAVIYMYMQNALETRIYKTKQQEELKEKRLKEKELERYRIQNEIAEEAKDWALNKIWKRWGREGLAKVGESGWKKGAKLKKYYDDPEAAENYVLLKQQDRNETLGLANGEAMNAKKYYKALEKHPYYLAYTRELEQADDRNNRVRELLHAYDVLDEGQWLEMEYYLHEITWHLEHYAYLLTQDPNSPQLMAEIKMLRELKGDMKEKLKLRTP